MNNKQIKKIYKLMGFSQNYDWGGKDFIPALIGIKNEDNKPFAEYWLGNHWQGPNTLLTAENESIDLANWLFEQDHFLRQIDKTVNTKWQIPFLLKILDVKKMLSIQLHPNKIQAVKGYEFEEKMGISKTSNARIFKDKNHKPEMMIALSNFWLLSGLAPIDKIKANLGQYSEFAEVLKNLQDNTLKDFYYQIMLSSQEEFNFLFLPICHQVLNKKITDANSPEFWLQKYLKEENKDLQILDRGILGFFTFNILSLKKGEAIFQGPDIPHAYLQGQNLEIMSCSDNVIRGGLTKKHIDLKAFLEHLDFNFYPPQLISPFKIEANTFLYQSLSCQDFAIKWIQAKSAQILNYYSASSEILLVLENKIKIINLQNNQEIELWAGETVFIPNEINYQLEIFESTLAVIAFQPSMIPE